VYEKIIGQALRDLDQAVEQMLKPTEPTTAPPRAKIFMFAENIFWPYANDRHNPEWGYFNHEGCRHTLSHRANVTVIVNECGSQPRKVLRCLRRIQAATAWCYARAEGRKRAAEEILRQQQGAADTLKAEAAMQALGKEGSK